MFLAMVLFALALTGMAFVGLLLNIAFFPEMWQQADLPRWIRYLAERES